MSSTKPITTVPLLTAVLALSTLPGLLASAAEIELLKGQPVVEVNEGIEVAEDGSTLTIRATNTVKVPILVIEKPNVPETGYLLKGEVRYDDVGGDGMLEMWNYFSATDKDGVTNEGQEVSFFSRTASDFGPMQKLSGTSGWRPFMLPFNTGKRGQTPTKLEVNALLPDGGTVMIRNLDLEEWAPSAGLEMTDRDMLGGWIRSSVTGTMVGLAVVGTVALVVWLRRRQLRKELQRMAIADTQI